MGGLIKIKGDLKTYAYYVNKQKKMMLEFYVENGEVEILNEVMNLNVLRTDQLLPWSDCFFFEIFKYDMYLKIQREKSFVFFVVLLFYKNPKWFS